MKDTIKRILENYSKAAGENFNSHPLMKFITREVPSIVIDKAKIDTYFYKIDGSAGKGRWAFIPWICIFDKDITTTATQGFYIVYLFKKDMSGVYLSLNQGWTYYENTFKGNDPKGKIQSVTTMWKSILKSSLNDFSFEPINLECDKKLAVGYELGHICGKYYPTDSLPDDSVLINDLRNLMGVYRELKGNMRNRTFQQVISQLLGRYEECDYDLVEELEEQGEAFKLNRKEAPARTTPREARERTFKGRNVDFEKVNRENKTLGNAGEQLVVEYEKNYLIENGRPDLVERVRLVTSNKEEGDGDGKGYDVISCELNEDEKFIEVKTTRDGIGTSFLATANEIEFSKRNSDKYYLYRVYNFNSKKKTGDLYVVKGSIEENFSLEPTQFKILR